MSGITDSIWPAERLAEAMAALVRHCGLADPDELFEGLPVGEEGRVEPAGETWIQALADRFGVEAEGRTAVYPEIEETLRILGPSLLALPAAGGGYLALAGSGRKIALLGPDLRLRRIPLGELCDHLREPLEAPVRGRFDDLLAEAGIPEGSRGRPLRTLFDRRLSRSPAFRAWRLRLPPQAPAVHQLRHAGIPGHVAALIAAHAVEYLLFAAAWWLLGRGALSGHLDRGWLWAWALLLLTMVPVRAVGFWSQGIFALGTGALLKRRLLAGALRSDPETIRRQGAGRFLGRVIESESIETLALNGGLMALLSGIELVLAAWVLSVGGAGGWHLGLLLTWLVLAAVLGWSFFRAGERWAESRIGMTHRLVERMDGQRTRLVQEPRANWHEAEDREHRDYLEKSRWLDRRVPQLRVLVTRSWLLVSLLALAPATVAGGASPSRMAVSLGGILLAYRAFQKLTTGFASLVGAVIAWRQVRSLFRAAARGPLPGSPVLLREAETATEDGARLMEAHQISYAYPRRSRPVFEGWDLELRRGERVLLEGASGSGKSTLTAVLAGLREPHSGRVTLRGIDPHGWGSLGWRQRVVAAPQFHENHIFVGSLAFNVLLGRGWPPSPQDLQEAEEICRRLGLGELITRMPAGMMQPVGESGWRLSHGERSRVCIARALLQDADVVILDESFAALDPETLRQALECARETAPTLVVVAHP